MGKKERRKAMSNTVLMGGEPVLDHEGGRRFYHKHLSPAAKAKKRKARKARKQAKRRNR